MLTRIAGWLRGLRSRLTALREPNRLDRELREELRFHLSEQVDKNVRAGMTRAEALLAARRSLGNTSLIQDEHRDARGVRWADELRQDIGYGARRLLARPWISAAAVLTLAVGIGSVTTIYGAAAALVLEPLQIPAIDDVVVLGEVRRGAELDGEGWAHPADYVAWSRSSVLETVAGLRRRFATITGTDEPAKAFGYEVFGDYSRVLGVEAAIGRTLDAGAGPVREPEVMLSHRLWRKHFGADSDVIGRTIRLDDQPYVIVGVMPDSAGYPMGSDIWWTPTDDMSLSEPFGRADLAVVGRLAPGKTLRQARAAMGVIAERTARLEPERHADITVGVETIRGVVTYGSARLMGFLMASAGFLLLLVCANVANLQLMHGTARRREMALRAALGASRGRLVRQLLAESLILALVGGILAAGVALWGTGLIRVALSGDWWRYFFAGVDRIGVNFEVLLFSLAVSLFSVLAFGLLPALRAARVDLTVELKQGSSTTSRHGPRGALVVAEVVLSVVIIAGGLLIGQVGVSTALADLGVSVDVASFTVRSRGHSVYGDPAALRRLTDDVLMRVRATPGMVSAAASSHVPGLRPGRGIELEVNDATAGGLADVNVRTVSDAFFATLGTAVVTGREFTDRDRDDGPPVTVLSHSVAAGLWPTESAIGKRVRLNGEDDWRTVVGVAADVARAWNDGGAMLAVYVPAAQRSPIPMVFLMQAEPGAADLARKRVWERYPDIPLPASSSVAATIAEQAAPAQMASDLMGAFAAVALLVCLGGIYALVGYVASLRVREVGVHMALGADRRSVEQLFVGHGVKLSGIGLAIGLPAGYVFTSVLARLLGRFTVAGFTVSAVPFLALGSALLALAALASYLPARRAAAIDPATVLRTD